MNKQILMKLQAAYSATCAGRFENTSAQLLEIIKLAEADSIDMDRLADQIINSDGVYGAQDDNDHYYSECSFCHAWSRDDPDTIEHKATCALLLAKKIKEES